MPHNFDPEGFFCMLTIRRPDSSSQVLRLFFPLTRKWPRDHVTTNLPTVFKGSDGREHVFSRYWKISLFWVKQRSLRFWMWNLRVTGHTSPQRVGKYRSSKLQILLNGFTHKTERGTVTLERKVFCAWSCYSTTTLTRAWIYYSLSV